MPMQFSSTEELPETVGSAVVINHPIYIYIYIHIYTIIIGIIY